MADPVTLALVAGIAGGGVSAFGQYTGGKASAAASNYAAQVAANNATIARQNAAYASAAGTSQAASSSMKGAAKVAGVKVAQAASGIDVNRGSAVDVQASERELSKLDTETVLSNAELQNYGYRTQATGFDAQSQLDKMQADNAETGGDLAAAGGLLSTASGVGFKWSQLGNTGG